MLTLSNHQVIGVIVADSHEEAVYAARKVVVQYEDLSAIISIQDAIEKGSFYPIHHEVTDGDVEKERREVRSDEMFVAVFWNNVLCEAFHHLDVS